MRWPLDLPPFEWPEPLLSEDGHPMQISQHTKDVANEMANAEFHRMQIRVAVGLLGITLATALAHLRRRSR